MLLVKVKFIKFLFWYKNVFMLYYKDERFGGVNFVYFLVGDLWKEKGINILNMYCVLDIVIGIKYVIGCLE